LFITPSTVEAEMLKTFQSLLANTICIFCAIVIATVGHRGTAILKIPDHLLSYIAMNFSTLISSSYKNVCGRQHIYTN